MLQSLMRAHPLRKMMWFTMLLVIIMAPLSGDVIIYEGWRIFPSLVAPSLLPMFAFIIPLDLTISYVFMYHGDPPDPLMFKSILVADLVLLLVMILAWLPLFVRLFS